MSPSLLTKERDSLSVIDKVLWAIYFVSAIFASALKLFDVPGLGEVFLFRALLPVFLILSFRFIRKKTKLQKYSLYLFATVLFYGALSLSWCTDKSVGVKALFNYAIMFLLSIILIAFFNAPKRLNFFLHCCSAILIILQILGIAESLTGRYFFDVDIIWSEVRNEQGLWSPITVFNNTNDFIFALVGYLPFFFISVDTLKKKYPKLRFVLKAYYVLITSYLAYAGQCRMGLILTIVILTAYLFFGKYHKVFKLIVAVGSIVALCTLPWWFGFIRTEARWIIWENVLKSAKHFFFFGVGVGNSSVKVPGITYSSEILNPHFWFLEIFVEFGSIVFGLVLVWYIYIANHTFRLLRRDRNNYRIKSIAVFLCAFIFLNMMCSSLAFFNMFYIFMCIVIGIIDECIRDEKIHGVTVNG